MLVVVVIVFVMVVAAVDVSSCDWSNLSGLSSGSG